MLINSVASYSGTSKITDTLKGCLLSLSWRSIYTFVQGSSLSRRVLYWGFYYVILGHESEFKEYVSSLPLNARHHLDLELDLGNGGVDMDLSIIADHMIMWEEKLSTLLGLTEVDIHDIKSIPSPVLQR